MQLSSPAMDRLKKWLEETETTHRGLCERLKDEQGVSLTPGAISQFINDICDPSIDTLKALSAVTGLSTDELLFGARKKGAGRASNFAAAASGGK